MQLFEIIKNIDCFLVEYHYSEANIEVNNICYDSRKICHGDVFIAIKGFRSDGHDFIKEAIENGAIAVIYQEPIKIRKDFPHIRVNNSRECLARMACIINENPSSELVLVGITGTNGKTTISYILEEITKKTGFLPGVIGTINHRFRGNTKNHFSTTPESLELQKIMFKMLQSEVTHVIMEVSSHALALNRIDGCKFDVAIFTNLTQDHLDYHLSMESYWYVKQKLFKKYLKNDGIAIINVDDFRGKKLAEELSKKIKVIKTGSKVKNADVYASKLFYSSSGTKGRIVTPKGEFAFATSMLGEFNMSNILSAVGASMAMGISLPDISHGIHSILSVPGRLELIDNPDGIIVYIDYAHTPDALESVLKTLSLVNQGRIITIFGCGGGRDKTKRGPMGRIAAKLSDLSVVTSDNPRFENPKMISDQIVKGIHRVCKNYISPKKLLEDNLITKNYTVILDRKKAIFIGISVARKGDTILITGKGHEKFQIVGHRFLEFDDKKEVDKALKATRKIKNINLV